MVSRFTRRNFWTRTWETTFILTLIKLVSVLTVLLPNMLTFPMELGVRSEPFPEVSENAETLSLSKGWSAALIKKIFCLGSQERL